MRLRLASAAVLAPLAFGCMWVGGVAWAGLVALGTFGLVVEWMQLCAVRVRSAWGVAAFAILAGVLVGGWFGAVWVAALVIAAGAATMRTHSRAMSAGVVYIGLPCLALVWLRADPLVGRANLLLLIFVVWATDIGAYVVGRWLGGPKLAPRVSPGKTWSGAAGGLLAAVVVGLAIAPRAAMVAAALSVVAQAGDLLESGIKRQFGVKDSGRLIPGHGGLLDRLDGVLTASVLAALLAYGKGRGVLIWL